MIRTVISELLNNIHELHGEVVSVTTDGFITNLNKLEEKILELTTEYEFTFFKEFKLIRKDLLNESDGLEMKGSDRGILSFCTRGQISTQGKIIAATGLQRGTKSSLELSEELREAFRTDKLLIFLAKRLRSPNEIIKHGGHVTEVITDKQFRLYYDNKRVITQTQAISTDTGCLLISRPLNDVSEGSLLRGVGKILKTNHYNTDKKFEKAGRYKSIIEIAIRNFIKALLKNELNLRFEEFKNYTELIDYIHEFNDSLSLSRHYISVLKNRKRSYSLQNYKKDPNIINFCNFVLKRFPKFQTDEFLK